MAQAHDVKYEDALKRLEKLVTELDKPELELEARLKTFEEGTKLARTLLKRLEQAKRKVEVLVKTHVGARNSDPSPNKTPPKRQCSICNFDTSPSTISRFACAATVLCMTRL